MKDTIWNFYFPFFQTFTFLALTHGRVKSILKGKYQQMIFWREYKVRRTTIAFCNFLLLVLSSHNALYHAMTYKRERDHCVHIWNTISSLIYLILDIVKPQAPSPDFYPAKEMKKIDKLKTKKEVELHMKSSHSSYQVFSYLSPSAISYSLFTHQIKVFVVNRKRAIWRLYFHTQTRRYSFCPWNQI